MTRLLLALFALLALVGWTAPVLAEASDVDAAARGVVRVVVIGRDGETIFVVSHGTGFAVSPEMVVTNAHVVAEAVENPRLSLGIVPSDGGNAVFARLVAVSERNDLALIETTSPMRLPPLTIAGNPAHDAGAVTAVGYPQNVDRAQGLEMADLFRAQPPVKATGFLSGRRPSREFDTLLHTAPIARGSSGGPLLDDCGRVVGVNSFGAQSAGTDAEFFFAVSTRELLPFLRANDVSPRINALPCRSLADLEAEERARAEEQGRADAARAAEREALTARQVEEKRRAITYALFEDRANAMALAFLLLVAALGTSGLAAWAHWDERARVRNIAGAAALVCLAGAVIAWLSQPAFAEIDTRLEEALRAQMGEDEPARVNQNALADAGGAFTCTLDEARSRVTGAVSEVVPIEWSANGCINARTQYAREGSAWIRGFVPASEAAVSVNRLDPAAREFVMERYLLDRATMERAREARASFKAPSCDASPGEIAGFAARQAELVSLLPARPHERLVYKCEAASE